MKSKITSLIENWWVYAFTIALGAPVGIVVSSEKMVQALIVIGTVILTALIATLLVPFAGFSLNERWQKLAVQYGAVPTFGTYAALLYRWAGWPAMLLVLPPLVVHGGYWQSSMHSRKYRLELYELGFAARMQYTTKLISMLSVRRMQHIADADIISPLLAGEPMDLTRAKEVMKGCDSLFRCVEEDISRESKR